MVKNDENIHFRELEPKLCYWGDQSGDTVLVQLSTEGELLELNPIEIVETKALNEPVDSAWYASRENHSWQGNPNQL